VFIDASEKVYENNRYVCFADTLLTLAMESKVNLSPSQLLQLVKTARK
jgi:hypothetical protein